MKIFTVIIFATVLVTSTTQYAAGARELEIGSATTVGVYYAEASAIAKIFNKKQREYGTKLFNVASQGSEENVDNVLAGRKAFGIAQSDVLYRISNGIEPWSGKPNKTLRAVMRLHTEAMTIVVAEDANIMKLGDIRGKKINIGAIGSSDEEYALDILKRVGLKPEDLELSRYPAAIASDLLQEGKIDAYFFTVGHPNLSVKEATSGSRKVRILSLDDKLIDEYMAISRLVKKVVIDTSYYPTIVNKSPVMAVGVDAIFFTGSSMDEETVYRLLKEVMSNIELLKRQHPILSRLKTAEMADVSVIPLHPGAERYFKECGLIR